MVAELNTVVPSFHMITKPPTQTPVAPWMTPSANGGLDYYINMSPQYGMRIKQVMPNQSDEKTQHITYTTERGANGEYSYTPHTSQVDSAIYYNKAGFNKQIKSHIDGVTNTINYTLAESGRLYNTTGLDLSGNGIEGETAEDTLEWTINLPVIGNAISDVWDMVYGEPEANSTARPYTLSNANLPATKTTYDSHIYYTGGKYKYYQWDPVYTVFNGTFSNSDTYYYYDENTHIYHQYNNNCRDARNSNNTLIGNAIIYTRTDSYTLTELDVTGVDALMAMLREVNETIGINTTKSAEVRSEKTLIGAIGLVQDLIRMFGGLKPGHITHVNNQGILETVDNVYYPSSNTDRTKVLVGQPGSGTGWENRAKTFTITAGSSENTGYDTGATANAKIDLNNSKNDNNLNFAVGNKWIRLNASNTNELITISHKLSDLAAHNFADNFSDTHHNGEYVANNENDESLSRGPGNEIVIPVFATDNGGHVTSQDTKQFHIPNSYNIIRIGGQSDVETEMTTNTDSVFANKQDSDLKFCTGNKWIRLKSHSPAREDRDIDEICIAHAVSALSEHDFGSDFSNTHYTTASTNPENAHGLGNTIVIPVFTTDNAGHVITQDTKNFHIPNSFNTVAIGTRSTDEQTIQHTGTTAQLAEQQDDTLTLNIDNKWLLLGANNDNIYLAHTLTSDTVQSHNFGSDFDDTHYNASYTINGVNDTTITRGPGNEITIPVFTIDKAGHVVGKATQSFHVPNSFNTIAIARQSSALTEMNTNTTSQIAESLDDTLTFATDNKWIRLCTTNDTVHIAHCLTDSQVQDHDFGEDFKDIHYSESSQGVTAGNTITIPVFSIDNAGHVTTKDTKSFHIPNSFSTIAVSTQNTNATDMAANTNSQIAELADDTFTFATGNKWIHLKTEDDKLYIAHAVPGIAETATVTKTIDSANTFGKDIEIQQLVFDAAGHLTNPNKRIIHIPTITIANNVTKTSANVLTDTAFNNNGILTLTRSDLGALQIGATLYGDAYKPATLTTSKDNISIEASDFTAESTLKSIIQTLDARIMAEEKNRQNAIYALDVDGFSTTQGRVLINVAETNGKISASQDELGDVQLGAYSTPSNLPEGTTASAIASTTMLKTALATLDRRIIDEEVTRANAITAEVTARNTAITNAINALDATSSQTAAANNGWLTLNLTEANGKITAISGSITADTYDPYGAAAAVDQSLVAVAKSGNASDVSIADTNALFTATNVEAALAEVASAVATLNGDANTNGSVAKAIANLDKSDNAVTRQFVTAVSETDGIITVSRAALTANDIPALAIGKITNLQSTLNSKTDKVTSPTAGDFASLDANGNITDSGKKMADFATAAQGALASSAVQIVASGSTNGTIAVDGTNVSIRGLKSAAFTESSAYLPAPTCPTTDGTYILQCVVTNGAPTYSWVLSQS